MTSTDETPGGKEAVAALSTGLATLVGWAMMAAVVLGFAVGIISLFLPDTRSDIPTPARVQPTVPIQEFFASTTAQLRTTTPQAFNAGVPVTEPDSFGDLDCEDFSGSVFIGSGEDPHGLDADNDGIGCE